VRESCGDLGEELVEGGARQDREKDDLQGKDAAAFVVIRRSVDYGSKIKSHRPH
jgi:hypothetical protein